MDNLTIVIIFLLLTVGGFLIEVFATQFHFLITGKGYKKYHYSIGRYLFYLLFPTTALFFVFANLGREMLIVFVAFSIVGTFLEWFAGYAYHMVVGQRLWTYHRYSISGYTSLLSIFLWGLGGVLFWLLARLFQ